jgi:hypothetical protein
MPLIMLFMTAADGTRRAVLEDMVQYEDTR